MKRISVGRDEFWDLYHEAEKTLEYTFCLKNLLSQIPHVVDELTEEQKVLAVSGALEGTWEIIKSYLLPRMKDNNFFGEIDKGEKDTHKWDIFDIWNDNSLYCAVYTMPTEDFLWSSILDHCVVSAYDAIHSYNLDEKKEFKASDLLNIYTDKAKTADIESARSNYSQRTKRCCRMLKEAGLENIFTNFTTNIPQSQIGLYRYIILNKDGNELKRALKTFKGIENARISDANKYLKEYEKFVTEAGYRAAIPKGTSKKAVVNRLINEYRVENIFGDHLLGTIMTEIADIDKTGGLLPMGEDLTVIAEIAKLPNAFTRTLFLRYAIAFLKADIYLDNRYYENLFDGVQSQRLRKTTMLNWLERYHDFCTFLGEMLFPIAQWLFIIYFTKSFSSENRINISTMHYMESCLEEYLFQNAERIQNPLVYLSKYIEERPYENPIRLAAQMLRGHDKEKSYDPIQPIKEVYDGVAVNMTLSGFVKASKGRNISLPVLSPETVFNTYTRRMSDIVSIYGKTLFECGGEPEPLSSDMMYDFSDPLTEM